MGITNHKEGEVPVQCKCKCTRKKKQDIIHGLIKKGVQVESSRDEDPCKPNILPSSIRIDAVVTCSTAV